MKKNIASMFSRNRAAALWCAAACLGAAALRAAPLGSVYNPADYPALNGGAALNYSSGTLTFDTDSGAVAHSVDGSLGTGAVDQPNASTLVKMTVFTFSSVNLQSGVTITITGQRGMVLASQGDLTVGSGVNVNVYGTAGLGVVDMASYTWDTRPGGSNATNGRGGPGADGSSTGTAPDNGNRGGGTESAPPGQYGGDGGFEEGNNNSTAQLHHGRGVGGGLSAFESEAGGVSAGGAAYGGTGGLLSSTVYGDNYLENLYGGSGGGGGGNMHRWGSEYNTRHGVGGGGGGSLELVAVGVLRVDGTIHAYGGKGGQDPATSNFAVGGGGSGGGVLLAGSSIVFSGTVNAYGGNGGAHTVTGGVGGGGRVAFYVGSIWAKSSVNAFEQYKGDWNDDGTGSGTDFESGSAPDGLTFNSGSVVVRRGTSGTTTLATHGTFYVLVARSTAGTMMLFK